MSHPTFSRNRIQSIDVLRGIAMVIMALDHVRDFFFKADVSRGGASVALDPTNLATTTPLLFFTRWITHFCAPTFVFLAGTSVFLMGQKNTKAEMSIFLFKRGLWLVLAELVIISLAWTYNPFYNLLILQVIWAIGISMILLALIIQLPFWLIFSLGVVIVFGHNLLDYPDINRNLKGGWLADILYFSNFSIYNLGKNHFFIIIYAFLPWLGVMILGYCFGRVYAKGFDAMQRKKILLRLGMGLISLFIFIRVMKGYGDPFPMSQQPRGAIFTALSFVNVNKYPPSLAFLAMTIGTGMLLLVFLENIQNKVTAFFRIYGRVPMLYYILHLYLIHAVAVVVFFAQGFSTGDIITNGNPFLFKPPGFGFGLLGVYAVWLFVFLALYPLCKRYDSYKSTHKRWWHSYI
jgi:uncharacterized membrane protein